MLGKIMFTAGLLFLAFNVWLHFRPIPPGNQVYSYWVKENHAKAQKYLHPEFKPSIVLCGSSLSAAMTHWLADSIYDFSMVGGSWITGLEIIHRTQKLPRIVGIEINFLLRTEDIYITEDALQSNWIPVRKFFPVFYAYNQPLDILTSDWQKVQMRNRIADPVSKSEIFSTLIADKKKEYQEEPDSVLSIEMVEYIRELTAPMAQKGCKTFFYLMPMDSSLMKSPRVMKTLAHIKQLNYPLIIPNNNFQWKTVDGEHLSNEYALLCSEYLAKQVQQIHWDK